MSRVKDPRTNRPPARALRRCDNCGRLVTDAIRDDETWVCRASSCAPSKKEEKPLTRFTTPRCDRCGTETDVRLVEVIEQGTGPGGSRYGCLVCVPFGRGQMDDKVPLQD